MVYRSNISLPRLPVLSIRYSMVPSSASLSRSHSSFFSTPGAALERRKTSSYFPPFITSCLPLPANSTDATIIVYPDFFSFTIFIFLDERSHLVFRLLYNWKMMRWQMHINVRGHPKIDGRTRRRIYRWCYGCCHLQKGRERERRDKQTYLFCSFSSFFSSAYSSSQSSSSSSLAHKR